MYSEALAVQEVSPSACAVMIGRTLEAVCREQNVQGRNLQEQLNNLLDPNQIGEKFSRMGHGLRRLRNLGAHFDPEQAPKPHDVPVMLDFVEAILEIVYDAPAKIAALESRFSKQPERVSETLAES
jgi:hypothetical protein